MKKFFASLSRLGCISLVALIIACGSSLPALAATTATAPATPAAPGATPGSGGVLGSFTDFSDAVGGVGVAAVSGGNVVNAAVNASNAAAGAAAATGNAAGNVAINVIIAALAGVAYGIMWVAGYLLGIVGVLFNWLVVITIFQFGSFFGNSTGLLAAWNILRQIGNILILFGFIYAGISMILDLHSYDARKFVPLLLIFAVLLNFSLFAAEAIVDVANVLSASFYQEAGKSVFTNCTNVSQCTTSVGIAEVILQDTYVGSAFGSNSPTTAAGTVNTNAVNQAQTATASQVSPSPLVQLLAYVGTTILITVVMMVMLAACIMFVIRGITLVIVFILSPIGFAGMAIPQLEPLAKRWWDMLLANAFFAPVFLLILFAGLKVMDGLRGTLGNVPNLATALASPSTSIGTILIVYAMVIGFFVAALIFAKNSGAVGASFATSYAQRTVLGGWKGAGRLAGNATGMAVRKPVGKIGRGGARAYNRFIGTQAAKGGIRGWAAKNFDYMAGGAITSRAEGLANVSILGAKPLSKVEKDNKSRDHAREEGERIHKMAEARANQRGVIGSPNDPAEIARDKEIADVVTDMGKKEKIDILNKVDGRFDDILRNLKHSDYEDLLKSDDLDHHAKAEMKNRRYNNENAGRVAKNLNVSDVNKVAESAFLQPNFLAGLNANKLANVDPSQFNDPATEQAIVAYVRGHAGNPDIDKFRGLINQGGTPGITNTNMTRRWQSVNF